MVSTAVRGTDLLGTPVDIHFEYGTVRFQSPERCVTAVELVVRREVVRGERFLHDVQRRQVGVDQRHTVFRVADNRFLTVDELEHRYVERIEIGDAAAIRVH